MPFDPWRHAAEQGVAILRCRLPGALLGLYSPNPPPLILLREGLSESWERVVLTHEVSHHDTPGAFLGRLVHMRRSGVVATDSAEGPARRLAWERLLPAGELRALLARGADEEEIAAHFQVPPEVVPLRMRALPGACRSAGRWMARGALRQGP